MYRRFTLCSVVIALLSGCVSPLKDPTQGEDGYSAHNFPSAKVEHQNGSLFGGRSSLMLFNDHRAHKVGDIITVVLDEHTVSAHKSGTSIDKSNADNISSPVIFGNTGGGNLQTGLASNHKFDGSTNSMQQNLLQGQLTVVVQKVMPNGVLFIKGEKWIKLNQGSEYVRVTGYIRPEDINDLNEVSSQRVADANIAYSGTGALADANRQGWLSRFFSSKWFPF